MPQVSHPVVTHEARIHHFGRSNINQVVDVLWRVEAESDGMALTSDRPSATARPVSERSDAPLVARISRPGALSGLAGVVFYAIGVLLPGSAPRPDAATSQVAAFLVDHRDALLTGFALQLVGLGLFLCFLGQLRTLVAGPGGACVPLATATAAGWVVLMAIVAGATLPVIAIVWRGAGATSPGLVRLAYDVQTLGTYAASATAAVVSVGAPSLAIWRHRILPRWLAILGVVAVAANVVELTGLASRHGSLAGGTTDGVGLILWIVWVAAVSVSMGIRDVAAGAPTL
jgi:hypothetical protein